MASGGAVQSRADGLIVDHGLVANTRFGEPRDGVNICPPTINGATGGKAFLFTSTDLFNHEEGS
jgi:hypothetical protein